MCYRSSSGATCSIVCISVLLIIISIIFYFGTYSDFDDMYKWEDSICTVQSIREPSYSDECYCYSVYIVVYIKALNKELGAFFDFDDGYYDDEDKADEWYDKYNHPGDTYPCAYNKKYNDTFVMESKFNEAFTNFGIWYIVFFVISSVMIVCAVTCLIKGCCE